MVRGVIWDFMRTLYDPESGSLTAGARSVLEHCKQHDLPMCLLSSQGSGNREQQIQACGIQHFFVDIQIIAGHKTAEHFIWASYAMDVIPRDILLIGDRVKKEIVLGNRFDATTVWYRRGKFAQEEPGSQIEKPNYTITDLKQVIEILLQLTACPS